MTLLLSVDCVSKFLIIATGDRTPKAAGITKLSSATWR